MTFETAPSGAAAAAERARAGLARGDRSAAGETAAACHSLRARRDDPAPGRRRGLEWSERTVRRRLVQARARPGPARRTRPAPGGLTPNDAMLGAVFLREARSAIPVAPGARATFQAAAGSRELHPHRRGGLGGGRVTHSRGAQDHAGPEAQADCGCAARGRLDDLGCHSRSDFAEGTSPRSQLQRRLLSCDKRQQLLRFNPSPHPTRSTRSARSSVNGRVLDPDGKPVAGGGVYVLHYAEVQWLPIDPTAARQKGRVAATDTDGRFDFEIDKAAGDVQFDGRPGWHKAQIAAAAPGFAPAWVEAGDLVKKGEATLRLMRDDVPVRGRVLNSEGQPVAGVVVRIRAILGGQGRRRPRRNAGLEALRWMKTGLQISRRYGYPLGPTASTWQADPAQGRYGRAAGTPGSPARPTVGSRCGGSAATASPG